MAVLAAPPQGATLVFKINPHDGTLSPCDPNQNALGPGTLAVYNMGADASLPTGAILNMIYANAGLPMPFGSTARFALNWQQVKAAGSTGVVCNTY